MNNLLEYIMKRVLNNTMLFLLTIFILINCSTTQQQASGWDQVPDILAQIVAPTFPDRNFDITQYGAVGDGTTDCSDAIRQAMTSCNTAGGGRVVIPAGKFLTGPIHLKSNVNLHLAAGSTILFSRDYEKYLPLVFTRWEGTELMNYSPFIYAFEQENIAITGSGTLDGQANTEYWWWWTGDERRGWTSGPSARITRPQLLQWADEGRPVAERVFPEGSYLRPPFVQPYRCKNVLIEGVTIINSPHWELNPVLCENVTVRGIKINTHGPNNDGCDPESCKNVLIEDCDFDTGDDCIAIKSGRDTDGRRVNVPSENIIIRNCRMKDGHGGVVLGSEISGGIKNVFAENCVMDSPNLERALRIKTNSMRGGYVENVYFRNVQVGEVADAVVRVNFYYSDGDAGTFTPYVKNINVENITSEKSEYGILLMGYPQSPVTGVSLKNCNFKGARFGNSFINAKDITAENVTVNGKSFTGVEEDMVPEAVQSALAAKNPGGIIERVYERNDDGHFYYEFRVRVGEDAVTMKVMPDGAVM
jgi:polygalacturonase